MTLVSKVSTLFSRLRAFLIFMFRLVDSSMILLRTRAENEHILPIWLSWPVFARNLKCSRRIVRFWGVQLRTFRKLACAMLLWVASTVLLLPAVGASTSEAYFQFSVPPSPETFVIRLVDPALIQQARAILAAPEGKQIMGKIVKAPAFYNTPWSFHLDPHSIQFDMDFAAAVQDRLSPCFDDKFVITAIGGRGHNPRRIDLVQ